MAVALRSMTVALVASALLLLSGCGAAIRSAAASAPRTAVPVAIDEMFRAMEDPDTRQRMERVMATPEVQRVIRQITAAVVASALEETSSEGEREHLDELMTAVTTTVAHVLADALREPVADATRTAIRTASDEIPETLAPSLRRSLTTELRSPELREAVGGLTAEVTRQALVSSKEAVAKLDERQRASGLLDRVHVLISLSWALAIGACVGALGLLAWTIHIRKRTKRFQAAVVHLLLTKSEGEEKIGEVDAFLQEFMAR